MIDNEHLTNEEIIQAKWENATIQDNFISQNKKNK